MPKISPSGILRQSEIIPIFCRCTPSGMVITRVEKESSLLSLYTLVSGSRKFFVHRFWEPLSMHFSSPAPTPKDGKQRPPFGRAGRRATQLGRCRKPLINILSHDFVRFGQKHWKIAFFSNKMGLGSKVASSKSLSA